MTSKTSITQVLAAAALCYSVNAFSASRGAPTTHHWPPQTRLFQETVSGRNIAASFPIISREELEADMLININNNSASKTISSPQEVHAITATTKEATTEELVPSTWSQALHHFFLKDIGPPLVVLTISGFILTRCQLLSTTPFSITELAIFASSITIWWIQEYFFHRVLLHSPFDWIGKSIHGTHHDKEYFHISIDPPALLLGWLFAAYLILKAMLPQCHLCLSATIGYSLAGLVYEWSHYIVHTKVKPRIIPPKSPTYQQLSILERTIIQPIMRGYAKMRDNHIRHHLIDDRYWYAFSVTEMDDLFGTNPNVKDVKREIRTSREGFQ